MSEYVNAAGAEVAHFEYDPFGNLTVDDQGNAASFPYRFSTKPQDGVSGLYYYGYRWYDPVTGRWPSRDPIGERGGVNLYGFVNNDGVNKWDYLGLVPPTIPVSCAQIAPEHKGVVLRSRVEKQSNARFDFIIDPSVLYNIYVDCICFCCRCDESTSFSEVVVYHRYTVLSHQEQERLEPTVVNPGEGTSNGAINSVFDLVDVVVLAAINRANHRPTPKELCENSCPCK